MTARVLLLIDWQVGFDNPAWGPRNNPNAEAVAARLIAACRAAGVPVWHVHHHSLQAGSPLAAGSPGTAPQAFARPLPGEPCYRKSVNSAFIGTSLQADLQAAGIDQLLVSGVTTDHCVSTSTRMAGNFGFDVHLVADACYCHDRRTPQGQVIAAAQVHAAHLASLHQEFATVQSFAEVQL